MLVGHPKVSPEKLRVRFRQFGDYFLGVEIFAYVRTNEYYEYWAIREDLNLRIMDIVKEAGTGFAFPSQTAYWTRDSGLDGRKSQEAEERIKEWREKGNLPFPEFDENYQSGIENKLDYPPTGSSHAGKRKKVPRVDNSRSTSQSK